MVCTSVKFKTITTQHSLSGILLKRHDFGTCFYAARTPHLRIQNKCANDTFLWCFATHHRNQSKDQKTKAIHRLNITLSPTHNKNQRKKTPRAEAFYSYPERDLNPHDPFGSTEFKSVVSTNSTIRAWIDSDATKVGFHQRIKTNAPRFSLTPHAGFPTTLFQLAQTGGSSQHRPTTQS